MAELIKASFGKSPTIGSQEVYTTHDLKKERPYDKTRIIADDLHSSLQYHKPFIAMDFALRGIH